MSVDLRTCVKGQKLLTKHGTILTYVGPSKSPDYPHEIEYPDGSKGTRLDDGHVYRNSLPTDEDVVEILPTNVVAMALCEVEKVILRPNQLYLFVVMPDCPKCESLASVYA